MFSGSDAVNSTCDTFGGAFHPMSRPAYTLLLLLKLRLVTNRRLYRITYSIIFYSILFYSILLYSTILVYHISWTHILYHIIHEKARPALHRPRQGCLPAGGLSATQYNYMCMYMYIYIYIYTHR